MITKEEIVIKQSITNKNRITKIKCPNCLKSFLTLKKDYAREGNNVWICHNCVAAYPENLFDIYAQHEKECVERGDGKFS